eukprot:1160435-Pelagomonas_calceolata.AAC.3
MQHPQHMISQQNALLAHLPCLLVHGRSRRPQGAVSIAALTFILIRPSLTADGPLLYLHTSSIQPICCLPLMYTSARAWSVFVPTWLTTALTACQSSFASLLCHTRTYNNTSTLGPITSAVAVWRSVHLAIALCMACYAFPGPLLPCRFPLLFLLLHNLCRADHLLAGIAHANQCGPVAFCGAHKKGRWFLVRPFTPRGHCFTETSLAINAMDLGREMHAAA